MVDNTSSGAAPLADPRHEKFAQAFAAGQTKAAAYKAAGFKPKHGNSAKAAGHRLFTRDDVRERVEFLKNAASRAGQDAMLNMAMDSVVTKELVKGMLLIQARRNMGFMPVTIDVVEKKTGRIKSVTRTVYDPKAANVTLNLLGQEVGLFEGGSDRGDVGDTIDARAKLEDPSIQQDLENLNKVRSMVLIESGLAEAPPAPVKRAPLDPVQAAARLKKLAEG